MSIFGPLRKMIPKKLLNSTRAVCYQIFGNNKVSGRYSNRIVFNGAILRGCTIKFFGHSSQIIMGGGNILNGCTLNVFGDNCKIIIGRDSRFENCIFWLEDNGSEIVIGDSVQMCGRVHMGVVEGTKLQIGDECLFSSDIHISTTDSHSILDLNTKKRINPSSNVTIGNHVWVGQRANIGKGVYLADDIIIGGCAFVTKSVEESHVAIAGVPAKVVKRGITWDIKRI